MSKRGQLGNRGLLMNFAVEALASPGLVMDASLARKSPCTCYTYDSKKICYSKGVVGALSKTQTTQFCNPMIKIGKSKRIEAFVEAAEATKKKVKKKDFKKWTKEMGKQLRKRGVEL